MSRDETLYNKNIFIAPIIDSWNYGTVLQAVATNEIMSCFGTPIFIDYCRPGWRKHGWMKTYLNDKRYSPAINFARVVLNIPAKRKQAITFRGFIEKHLKLCDPTPFICGGTFDEDSIYCVGSDQTWNYEYNSGVDPVYYLSNVPNGYKKIAYCASFGRENVSQAEVEDSSELISQFNAISVREKSGIQILQQFGYESGIVLGDPVLICDGDYWYSLCKEHAAVKNRYILIYMLNYNEHLLEYARKLSIRMKSQIRIITLSKLRRYDGMQCEYIVEPEKWLALFRDATYVITDSFHGTCFSMVFHKNLTVFLPPTYSVRLRDVLSEFNLQDRIMDDSTQNKETPIEDIEIDWKSVDESISMMRINSEKFLEDSIAKEIYY